MKKILSALGASPILWGLVATFGFYYAINRGVIANETVVRYASGHPVEYVTIAMFFVGLCDLAFKCVQTRNEGRSLRRGALFPPKKTEKEPVSKAREYQETVSKARRMRGDSTYLRRLADALDFLTCGGAPDELDQELRFLADDATDRRDAEYGMTRAFIWAIPILGFLGTVLGITAALGSLDLTQLNATSERLAAGLKVAFDTTALSLSLVFALFFGQFFSRRQDATLARRVSKLVDAELKGRFYDDATNEENALESTVAALNDALRNFAAQAALVFSDVVNLKLNEGGASWTQSLADAQRRFISETLAPTLDESSKRLEKFDALVDKVGDEMIALRQILQTAADANALEAQLAGSLERLAEVGEFEKTLNNLSATVCLLNSKLTSTTPAPKLRSISELRPGKRADAIASIDALDDQRSSFSYRGDSTDASGKADREEGYERKRSA